VSCCQSRKAVRYVNVSAPAFDVTVAVEGFDVGLQYENRCMDENIKVYHKYDLGGGGGGAVYLGSNGGKFPGRRYWGFKKRKGIVLNS